MAVGLGLFAAATAVVGAVKAAAGKSGDGSGGSSGAVAAASSSAPAAVSSGGGGNVATNRDIAQEIIDAIKKGSPDYVITQLVQEREDKIQKGGLAGSVPTTSSILDTAYAMVRGGGSAPTPAPTVQQPIYQQPTAQVKAVDQNGIADVSVAGYDPEDYQVYYYGGGSSGGSSSSSGTGSKIAGYVVIGLLGVVLLDRLMAGGKK